MILFTIEDKTNEMFKLTCFIISWQQDVVSWRQILQVTASIPAARLRRRKAAEPARHLEHLEHHEEKQDEAEQLESSIRLSQTDVREEDAAQSQHGQKYLHLAKLFKNISYFILLIFLA